MDNKIKRLEKVLKKKGLKGWLKPVRKFSVCNSRKCKMCL